MSTLRDETLSDLLHAFWQARLYLLIGGILGFIFAALLITFSVPHMRSIMIVAPTTEHTLTLHSEAAKDTIPEEPLPYLRYLKILTGPGVVADVMAQDQSLQLALEKSQRFTFQADKSFKNAEGISAYLSRQIVIKPVGATPLRMIEFEHPNPILAKKLLLSLHSAADKTLRTEFISRTENRMRYLKDLIAKTANPDHRQAQTNLLMEQERVGMMGRMDQYFAATLVEPPYLQPKPVWPRKSYIFPFCVFIGMLIGWVIFGIKANYTA